MLEVPLKDEQYVVMVEVKKAFAFRVYSIGEELKSVNLVPESLAPWA